MFRVVSVCRPYTSGDEIVFQAYSRRVIEAPDGRFRRELGSGTTVRVTASGYLPEETRGSKMGDRIEPVTMRLRRADPIAAIVVDPTGQPASDAEVAWVGPGQIAVVEDGKFKRRYTLNPYYFVNTNGRGRFELPPSRHDALIVVLHRTGYASVPSTDRRTSSTIVLTAWARIEGVLKDGNQTVHGATVSLKPQDAPSPPTEDTPIWWKFSETTHTDGSFAFDHVPTIPVRVGRQAEGFLSHAVDLMPKPGRTHQIQIGGHGATIEGSIAKPRALTMAGFFPHRQLGRHFTRVVAYPIAFAGTPLEQRPNYRGTLQEDGRFRLQDLPAGAFELSVEVYAPGQPYSCAVPLVLASGKSRFTVPSPVDPAPIVLPTLDLNVSVGPQVGQPVPALTGTTLDGTSFDLQALHGKLVLLDFWATWCGPCVAQTPRLKRLYDRFGRSGLVTFVGINLDHQPDPATRYVRKHDLPWPNLITKGWGRANPTLQAFGVSAIPSFWLIGPDGRVIARDVAPDALESVIRAAARGK